MIPANSRPAALPMPKLKLLNWKVIIPIIRPTMKKAQKANRSVTAVDRDKADTVGNGFNTSGIAANLQHIAFIEHHVIVDRHFNLAADHAVEETTVVGQLQLCQTAAHGIVVFHHNLFGDNTHVQQVAVKHLFPVAEARIETRVGVR